MKQIPVETLLAASTPAPWEPRLGQFDFNNDGSRPVMYGESGSEDRRRVAMMDSVIKRKRSTPYDAPDAERDANTALVCHMRNHFRELLEALSGVINMQHQSMQVHMESPPEALVECDCRSCRIKRAKDILASASTVEMDG